MPNPLSRESQAILEELGLSLIRTYDPAKMDTDPVIEKLLKKLNDIPMSRDEVFDQSLDLMREMLSKNN